MAENKTTIFQNPFLLSAGISAILSTAASNFSFEVGTVKIINVVIPPISLTLSYILAWFSAKFYTLSISEQLALSKLKAREKRIRKDMKKDDISQKTKQKLSKELDQIAWEKSQIGKAGSIVSESDN